MSWTNLLQESLQKAQKVPKGWKTSIQIAKECGKSDSYIRRQIAKLLRQGHIEMKPFMIKSGMRIYPVPHYRKLKG